MQLYSCDVQCYNEIPSARSYSYYNLTRVYLRVRVHRFQFPNDANKLSPFKTMSCCCIIPVPQITGHKHAGLLSWDTGHTYTNYTGYSTPYMGCMTSSYKICRGFSPKVLNKQRDKCWEIVGRLCPVISTW